MSGSPTTFVGVDIETELSQLKGKVAITQTEHAGRCLSAKASFRPGNGHGALKLRMSLEMSEQRVTDTGDVGLVSQGTSS